MVIFCCRLSNGLSREVIIKYTSTWSSVKNIYSHQTIHSMLFIRGFLKFIELGMCKTTFSFHNWLVSGFWMTSWCKESERGPVLGIFKTLFYLCMDVAHSIAVVVRRSAITALAQVQLHYISLNNQFPPSALLTYLHNVTCRPWNGQAIHILLAVSDIREKLKRYNQIQAKMDTNYELFWPL